MAWGAAQAFMLVREHTAKTPSPRLAGGKINRTKLSGSQGSSMNPPPASSMPPADMARTWRDRLRYPAASWDRLSPR